jgi:hypothetical protein
MVNSNRCTYYFELLKDRGDGIDSWKAGVYSSPGYMGAWHGGQSRLSYNSDRIWCQGPQGGVKIVKDRTTWLYGYVTKNKTAMKKFTWIKLSARPLELG